MNRVLRCALIGAVIVGAIGPFISYVPRYRVAGEDITWVIGTAVLMVSGAALGLGLGLVIDGSARLVKERRPP